MVEFDYGFLAEYASISGGKLSVMGGSFVETEAVEFPHAQPVSVVGRLRAREGFDPIVLAVEFEVPGESVFAVSGRIGSSEVDHVYDGKAAVLFCLNQVLYIGQPGLITVTIRIDGEVVRVLKFEVKKIGGTEISNVD